jgi:serine/threonine-protein kinase
MATQQLEPGVLFHDKYRLQSMLGSGGFARVYLATDEQLGRRVALKIMHPVGSSTVAPTDEQLQRFFKRFEREAKIISRLRAPEIVALYEFGRTSDWLAFMALEHVDGSNLWQIMRNEGVLAPIRVEKILIGVLRGLREAHQLGVHHRDLKPANIMVYGHQGEADLVKLLDFGVVKITKDVGVSYSSLTTEGNVVGTPRYMAPEYITDNEVSPQTDLYSLGLVAYELLTGESVVDGETAMEVMTAHITPDSASLPASLVVSSKLRAVVDGMLEKDCGRRFASASQVLELLESGRLAGHTQDELSLAATMESEQFYDVAFEQSTDVAREPASAPVAPVAPDDPQIVALGRRSKADELRRAQRSEPQKPGRSARIKTTHVVLALCVLVGLIVGAALWWALRS